MPAPNLTITVKTRDEHDGPESQLELVRTNGKYVYDEVIVREISKRAGFALFTFDYVRFGNKVTPPQCQVAERDWAVAAATVGNDRTKFGDTIIAQRLFSEGALHYNKQQVPVEEHNVGQDLTFMQVLSGDAPAQ
jgi:hypothetical protein